MLRLHKLRAFLTMLGVIIGVMSVTTIFTLSPGMIISRPSGSFALPVTSVVRK